jgi:hypothetical protein
MKGSAIAELVWELAICARGVKICKAKGQILKQNIYFSYYLKHNLCLFFGHFVGTYCPISVASVTWLA